MTTLRTHADALSRVGTRELVSYASGRNRHITWDLDENGDPAAFIYGVPVVSFAPAGVTVTHHGHAEPSTLDAIEYALTGHWRGGASIVRTDHRVVTILGHLGTDVLTVDYAGGLLYLGGGISTALAPARAGSRWQWVNLADVSEGHGAIRVTLTDDGGTDHADSVAYCRTIARTVARCFGYTGRAERVRWVRVRVGGYDSARHAFVIERGV